MAIKSTRARLARAARREQVAQLYDNGMSITEIGAYLGFDKATISRDINLLDEERLARAVNTLEKKRAREIAKLIVTELEAREAWARSVGESKTVKEEFRNSPGDELEDVETFKRHVETAELAGDPSFLNVILKCIQERAKLEGLYAPTKNEHAGAGGGPIETSNVVIYLPDNGRDRED